MRLCRHVQIFVAIMHVNRDITKMLESQIEVFLFVFFFTSGMESAISHH